MNLSFTFVYIFIFISTILSTWECATWLFSKWDHIWYFCTSFAIIKMCYPSYIHLLKHACLSMYAPHAVNQLLRACNHNFHLVRLCLKSRNGQCSLCFGGRLDRFWVVVVHPRAMRPAMDVFLQQGQPSTWTKWIGISFRADTDCKESQTSTRSAEKIKNNFRKASDVWGSKSNLMSIVITYRLN